MNIRQFYVTLVMLLIRRTFKNKLVSYHCAARRVESMTNTIDAFGIALTKERKKNIGRLMLPYKKAILIMLE